MKPVYQLSSKDIGKCCIKVSGRVYLLSSFIGRVLKHDIGKLVYEIGEGVLQVENDEQMKRRLDKKGK